MATIQFNEGQRAPAAISGSKQLLPNIVDGMATVRPNATYAETPLSPTSYEPGYQSVTYQTLSRAISGIAWILHNELGRGKNHETLIYIGLNDLSYVIIALGAVKAGYKMLSISPRSATSDYAALSKATGCNKIMASEPILESKDARKIIEALTFRVVQVPVLSELLTTSYNHYPYLETFTSAKDHPLLVVHTSGTTGSPKPITYTHDFAASCIQWNQQPSPEGFESRSSSLQSNRVLVTYPFFHPGAMFIALFDAIANQTTIVTTLSGVTPSAQATIDAIKITRPDAMLLLPPFVEALAKDPGVLDFISKHVRTAVYGGGDVAQRAGDTVAEHCDLFNLNGSTETGSYPLIRESQSSESKQDWKYIRPHPLAGIEFRPTGIENLHEGFIVRKAGAKLKQPVFKALPSLKEYATKDLFIPHSSRSGFWAFHSRADDVIVLKSGSKCSPITIEEALLANHPWLIGALMLGTGRSQPALLIEMAEDHPWKEHSPSLERTHELAIQELWPTVERINQSLKFSGRIAVSHILFTAHERPMQRAAKGTVQRKPTLSLYRDMIEELYQTQGDGIPGNDLMLPC